ncbi:hypothetical protein AC249_AIPGENE15405 [Exaiptasia diaphana]|nr:hypothetical protein AC249_AIPGENE15405 [Exaiptasia diaphana]
MAATFKPVTLGNLISKDLSQAYILPIFPLPADGQYDKELFINNEQYKVYDYPPPDPIYNSCQFAWKVSCAAGHEFVVLVDHLPYRELKEHWKQWLPVFPSASFKSISEGLADDTPLVTVAALESVPANKYSVHPDIIYELNRKSTILKIGVPCPKHMTPENVSFPCVVKVDMAWGGRGNILARNQRQFSNALDMVRKQAGWKGDLLIQEYLDNIIKVHDCYFYLFKSGEVFWLGVYLGQFDFSDGKFEWLCGLSDFEEECERKNYVYDKFIVPIAKFLHEKGYFGALSCEIVENEKGMFLVDLNVRISGECNVTLGIYGRSFDDVNELALKLSSS